MNKNNDLLHKQLHDANITDGDWSKANKDSLLEAISATYEEYERRLYLLEQNIRLLSDEISEHQHEVALNNNIINTISTKGVIVTDASWNIEYVNDKAQMMMDTLSPTNHNLFSLFTFINAHVVPIESDKFISYFDCGHKYLCQNGMIIINDKKSFRASFSITPMMSDDTIDKFIISFQNRDVHFKNQINMLQQHIKKEYQSCFQKQYTAFLQKKIWSCIQKSLWFNSSHDQGIDTNTTLFGQAILEEDIKSIQPLIEQDKTATLSEVMSTNLSDEFIISDFIDYCARQYTHAFNMSPITCHINSTQVHSMMMLFIIYKAYQITSHLSYLIKFHHHIDLTEMSQQRQESGKRVLTIHLNIKLYPNHGFNEQIIEAFFKEQPLDNSVQLNKVIIRDDDANISCSLIYEDESCEDKQSLNSHQIKLLCCQEFMTDEVMNNLKSHSQFKHQIIHADETLTDLIKTFKMNRLDQTEFNIVLFAGFHTQHAYHQFIKEASSYINDKFYAFIFITYDVLNEIEAIDSVKYITMAPNAKAHDYDDVLRDLDMHCYVQRQKRINSHMSGISKELFDAAFIDMEDAPPHTVMLLKKHQIHMSYHHHRMVKQQDYMIKNKKILILNSSLSMPQTLEMISELKKSYPEKPLLLIAPPLEEHEQIIFLNAGVTDFLFYPYRVIDFLYFISTNMEKKEFIPNQSPSSDDKP